MSSRLTAMLFYDSTNISRGFPRKHSNASCTRKSYSSRSRAHLTINLAHNFNYVQTIVQRRSLSREERLKEEEVLQMTVQQPRVQPLISEVFAVMWYCDVHAVNNPLVFE